MNVVGESLLKPEEMSRRGSAKSISGDEMRKIYAQSGIQLAQSALEVKK